jgi:hypothetical protein
VFSKVNVRYGPSLVVLVVAGFPPATAANSLYAKASVFGTSIVHLSLPFSSATCAFASAGSSIPASRSTGIGIAHQPLLQFRILAGAFRQLRPLPLALCLTIGNVLVARIISASSAVSLSETQDFASDS